MKIILKAKKKETLIITKIRELKKGGNSFELSPRDLAIVKQEIEDRGLDIKVVGENDVSESNDKTEIEDQKPEQPIEYE